MRYALMCTDKAEALQTRLENREAHLAYIAETGVVEMAGPLLDEADKMIGSLIIIEVETRADAEAWATNDPYAKAGLFAKTRIEAWKKVIG
jgi:uncharacterized protein YciI